MLLKAKEKKERSLGMRLFLKGERCNSPKCVMVRRPYRPGEHGKARRRGLSEYGTQLLEKQRIKVSYGLGEAQLSKIFKTWLHKSGSIGNAVVSVLERQFSNVVFRLGFASSRIVGRQFISHGHFMINGKKVTIPSYQLKIGDKVSINPKSKDLLIFKEISNIIKNHDPLPWLVLDKENLEGQMKSLPENIEIPFDINLVVDYYSK